MAESKFIPKQRILTQHETPSTFENWMDAIIFHITIHPKFARFGDPTDLTPWNKIGVGVNRGFMNDTEDVIEAKRMNFILR